MVGRADRKCVVPANMRRDEGRESDRPWTLKGLAGKWRLTFLTSRSHGLTCHKFGVCGSNHAPSLLMNFVYRKTLVNYRFLNLADHWLVIPKLIFKQELFHSERLHFLIVLILN
ncbi:hypothetical protein TNCV_235151 [Trichonephila clavipes]|uniref:Uncharacterized protein n=1 Tax=Trichonephila clavipes TaxID=2585209 RepID=A0A8X6SNU0_TRICX|nr:hypothetical protein TNCV_235151 [Trichonephila clavipes]